MAQAVGTSSQEYWRPSNPEVAKVINSIGGICWRCGMDYAIGARFCHVCGGSRERRNSDASSRETQSGILALFSRLGLSTPCLAFLAVAVVCALAALLTGAIYREDTLADWQAVQAWRIEWLLAAAVALLAGILFKKKA